MKISVVIPTYNEESNIKRSIDKALKYFEDKKSPYEIIISDDGSTDNTFKIVKTYTKKYKNIKIIINKHTGKAGAVRKGILKADGDIILFTDADFATPIDTIDSIIPFFNKGADIVIGSRAMGVRANEPFRRKLAGKVYNILVQAILLKGIDDTQAGFKAFSKEAAFNIFTSMIRFDDRQKIIKHPNVTGFDLEVLFLAKKLNYNIISIPVKWRYVESKRVSVIRDSYKLFFDLLFIRLNSILGRYDKKKSNILYSDKVNTKI